MQSSRCSCYSKEPRDPREPVCTKTIISTRGGSGPARSSTDDRRIVFVEGLPLLLALRHHIDLFEVEMPPVPDAAQHALGIDAEGAVLAREQRKAQTVLEQNSGAMHCSGGTRAC